MPKKIATIEDLGNLLQKHMEDSSASHRETRENFKSIGDHLISIESRLEELMEIAKLRDQLERMRQNIREKLHVEV